MFTLLQDISHPINVDCKAIVSHNIFTHKKVLKKIEIELCLKTKPLKLIFYP